MQDARGKIFAGAMLPEGPQRFVVLLALEDKDGGQPVFSAKFTHGPVN